MSKVALKWIPFPYIVILAYALPYTVIIFLVLGNLGHMRRSGLEREESSNEMQVAGDILRCQHQKQGPIIHIPLENKVER